RSMGEWAIHETRMRVERRKSIGGREGWTVTWKGRGWDRSFADYLQFFGDALHQAAGAHVPIVPSGKFHLPAIDEPLPLQEYRYTTQALLTVWNRAGATAPMPLEKDFSPTLAGDSRSDNAATVLRWLTAVPGCIESVAPGRVRLGVKVMNARWDDGFQLEML